MFNINATCVLQSKKSTDYHLKKPYKIASKESLNITFCGPLVVTAQYAAISTLIFNRYKYSY